MKEIILDCPCCHNQIYIELDDDFNILSIQHKCKKLNQVNSEFLQKHNIEFGVVNINKE